MHGRASDRHAAPRGRPPQVTYQTSASWCRLGRRACSWAMGPGPVTPILCSDGPAEPVSLTTIPRDATNDTVDTWHDKSAYQPFCLRWRLECLRRAISRNPTAGAWFTRPADGRTLAWQPLPVETASTGGIQILEEPVSGADKPQAVSQPVPSTAGQENDLLGFVGDGAHSHGRCICPRPGRGITDLADVPYPPP